MKKLGNMVLILVGVAFALMLVQCSDDTEPGQGASVTINGSVSNLASRLGAELQTPSEFQVVPLEAKLYRGLDDTDPGIVYEYQDGDPLDLVDLTSSAIELYSGDIPEAYLGTYTYLVVKVGAAAQEITYYEGDTASTKVYLQFYEDFDNTDGTISELPAAEIFTGDVLLWEDSSFVWWQIDTEKAYSYSSTRSEVTPYTASQTADLGLAEMELTEPITIEAGGSYVLNVTFDVSETFSYADRDANNQFNPVEGDHNGQMNGIEFDIELPAATVTIAE